MVEECSISWWRRKCIKCEPCTQSFSSSRIKSNCRGQYGCFVWPVRYGWNGWISNVKNGNLVEWNVNETKPIKYFRFK